MVSDAFSEYRARIPRIMQTAPRGVAIYTRSAVIKHDVDYCDLMVKRVIMLDR